MTRLSSGLRREWLSLILGATAAVLIANCIAGPRGVRDLMVLRARRMALEAQLRRVADENGRFETSVQKLRSDDRYVERLIRRELGFARPDELVYRFGGDDDGDR
jgi:cell division protein FtsB